MATRVGIMVASGAVELVNWRGIVRLRLVVCCAFTERERVADLTRLEAPAASEARRAAMLRVSDPEPPACPGSALVEERLSDAACAPSACSLCVMERRKAVTVGAPPCATFPVERWLLSTAVTCPSRLSSVTRMALDDASGEETAASTRKASARRSDATCAAATVSRLVVENLADPAADALAERNAPMERADAVVGEVAPRAILPAERMALDAPDPAAAAVLAVCRVRVFAGAVVAGRLRCDARSRDAMAAAATVMLCRVESLTVADADPEAGARLPALRWRAEAGEEAACAVFARMMAVPRLVARAPSANRPFATAARRVAVGEDVARHETVYCCFCVVEPSGPEARGPNPSMAGPL